MFTQTHTTVHTERIFQSHPDPMISATQLNCPLFSAILKPRGSVAVEKTCARLQLVWVTSYLYLHVCVWFGNENPNLFYWRTNNATKWYINLTTVDSYVHFTVDAIMYMYVNNLTGQWFSIYKVENEKFRAVWTVPIWRVINGKCAMNRLACEYLSNT